MKFSIGDTVILVATKEEGIVIDYLGDKLYLIESEDIEFPCYEENLKHPHLNQFLSEKVKANKEHGFSGSLAEGIKKRKVDLKQFKHLKEGVYLTCRPLFEEDFFDSYIASLDLFIYNNTPVDCKIKTNEDEIKKDLWANSLLFLKNVDLKDFENNSLDTFVLLYKNGKDWLNTIIPIRFSNKKFFMYLPKIKQENHLHFIEERPIWNTSSISEYLEKESNEASKKENVVKESFDTNKKDKKSENLLSFYNTKPEIDLHLDEILKIRKDVDYEHPIVLQLEYCEELLEEFYKNGIKELYIIHGIGKGALKKALHDKLSTLMYVDKFEHGYFENYGFGATKVFLKM